MAIHCTSLVREAGLARNLISEGLWKRVVGALGGTVHGGGKSLAATIDSAPLLVLFAAFSLFTWMGGAWCIARLTRVPYRQALSSWGIAGWLWWLLPIVWELLDLAAGLAGSIGAVGVLRGTLSLWHGAIWAGWMTTGLTLAMRTTEVNAPGGETAIPRTVWGAMLVYIVIFGSMNVGLYQSLMLPHGDSAMYEEHLWNLLHGKGFRSYLDGGRLFLGEHVQVIHLLLIPLYLVWPSHILLELVQSTALAAGAIPLYSIARRHGGSNRAAVLLALAYLLYVPMQNLDIAVDFKTFRPNSFEIPLFLAAFDALERRRWTWFVTLLAFTLLCQEDAGTIIAPLGLWIACRAAMLARPPGASAASAASADSALDRARVRRIRFGGIGLAAFGVVYVLLVIKVVLPWFRGGADVHFAQYFTELGDSSGSITAAVFRHPELVVKRLFDPTSISFGMALIVPLGLLPFLSPGRLAIAAPLFGVLCLSDITNSARHHFHAPLVPVILWAAAAGLATVPRFSARIGRLPLPIGDSLTGPKERRGIPAALFRSTSRALPVMGLRLPEEPVRRLAPRDRKAIEAGALWTTLCSACMGVFLGLSPLSLSFWDGDSYAYWRKMYVPGERSRQVSALLAQLPADCRVASTDFIHPRLTHFERSYDYSDYRPIVPDDADYIVIDARHPYSQIHDPRQIKELRNEPGRWELLPDQTNNCFFVLKRVRQQ